MMCEQNITLRKRDDSDSTKDFWRNGCGDAPYHNDESPCDDAPEHGYMMFDTDEIHPFPDIDVCPECEWPDWFEQEVAVNAQ